MNLAERVRTAMALRGVTVDAEVARACGRSPASISLILNGQTKSLKGATATKMAAFLKVNALWLVDGIGPMEPNSSTTPTVDDDNVLRLPPHENGTVPKSRRLYVKGTAQMGADGYWYDLEYPVNGGDGHIDSPTDDPLAYVIRVRGDSMFPAIRDNWLVVVEPNEALVPGLYVHVKTVDGRYMVKELLWAKDGELALHSVNQGFARLTLRPEEIEYAYYCFPLPPNKWRP